MILLRLRPIGQPGNQSFFFKFLLCILYLSFFLSFIFSSFHILTYCAGLGLAFSQILGHCRLAFCCLLICRLLVVFIDC